MLKFTFVAACCMLSCSVNAQFTLSGEVRGGEKKELLAGASVSLKGTGNRVLADKNGAFRFDKLPTASYTLLVRFLGYAPKEMLIELTGDQAVSIFLLESPMMSDEVIISALRAKDNTPTTFTNVSKEDIAKQNFGQDLPLILNWSPSVVTTSDAGAGVGYTGLRIRGSDASHINVTINGIPYNDSESQSVYWVDVPDVASSTQSIQIQRGVGTSTNGAGAFGGSVNLQTNSLQTDPYAEISNSYGSFNTQKHTFKAGTGLIDNAWAFDGRISNITSDGYIERASSNLNSYYLSGGYYGKKTLIKAIMFGGHEHTYQSWYGIDPAMMKIDRRFNYAGVIYNPDGTVQRYYPNQVDDYTQNNYQLHFSHQVNDYWNINAAVHYTYGQGYFEEYYQGYTYASLGLQNVVIGNDTIRSGDFIVREWLKNKFYGATWSAHHTKGKVDFTFGGAANKYGNAKHYGEIIWAQYAGPTELGHHYYDAVSQKTDINFYSKLNYNFSERLNGFADVQYRYVGYISGGLDDSSNPYSIDDRFNFFNPKAGLTYSLANADALYASYAIAHREPTRADYLGGTEKPRSEELGNLEVGWRRKTAKYTLETNYYLMNYHDQLVLTGKLNSGGYPIRANVGNSYRTGVEVSGSVRLLNKLVWGVNATWSRNKNKEYINQNADGTTTAYKNTNLILSPDWIGGSQLSWTPIKKGQITLLSKYVGLQYLDNTQLDAVKMAAYFVNDLRFSYSIAPVIFKEIEVGFLFNNIFNTMYSANGAAYSGVPYFYPQAGRNYLARTVLKF